ncbi:hypothetical protein HPP92_012790 [Vanilla planifolia]|uniref:Conserved oligomeric Golgi complex subunit 3 n=1 Tax=Vanilla planifolia TaxID=51239 RepID=A0A835QTR1_VANPL|nr:hypothetical protein HPP92_012790 [Vanilla planifolia]
MAAAPLPGSGAVFRGYNFANTWEQNAPLTEEQTVAVAALSLAASERPFPSNLSQEHDTRKDGIAVVSSSDSVGESGIAGVLVNTHQFYKWFTDLESAMKSETEEKYRLYVNTLLERIQICDGILEEVDDTLNLFNELQALQLSVATKTKTLHDACDRLLLEKQRLIDFAEALRSKLNYFDELENVSSHFYSPNVSIKNGQFLPLLKRLDDCISYVESNPQYSESGVYLVKFRQLQSRALGVIRSHVLLVLKAASAQVQAVIRGSGSNLTSVAEGLKHQLFMFVLKQQLVSSNLFWRKWKVKSIVQQRISEFAKKETLPSLTRSGCAYLMQVCQLEHQLFNHFFPSSSMEVSSMAPLIDPLCTYLYDILRPKLIYQANLDSLCELVDILRVEVIADQLNRRGESLAGLRPILQKILADINERLTFCARTYIRDEIANHRPSDEEVDYPAMLEKNAEQASQTSVDDNSNIFRTWYPPLEKTMSCLAQLYNCLEAAVFTGLAQEAVEFCSISIQNASKVIIKKSSPMDGQLFLIKHLLILREQIAPFDIEFSVTHKELDFSHLLEHLRRILRGQSSLFDWSRSTSFAMTLTPRILESQIDAKKELEKSLKTTCEEFIMSVTKLIVDPLLSFVTKVTAVKAVLSSSAHDKKEDSVLSKPLRSQAFASPEKIAELIHKVSANLLQELPKVVAKMKLYLQNPSTRMILFKPIKTNIMEAHVQLQSLIQSEYSSEELQNIGMVSIQHLQSQIDGLL